MHITIRQQKKPNERTNKKNVKRLKSIKGNRGECLSWRKEDLLHHKMCLNMSIKMPCKTSSTKRTKTHSYISMFDQAKVKLMFLNDYSNAPCFVIINIWRQAWQKGKFLIFMQTKHVKLTGIIFTQTVFFFIRSTYKRSRHLVREIQNII